MMKKQIYKFLLFTAILPALTYAEDNRLQCCPTAPEIQKMILTHAYGTQEYYHNPTDSKTNYLRTHNLFSFYLNADSQKQMINQAPYSGKNAEGYFSVEGLIAGDAASAATKVINALDAAAKSHPNASKTVDGETWDGTSDFSFDCIYDLDFSKDDVDYQGQYPKATFSFEIWKYPRVGSYSDPMGIKQPINIPFQNELISTKNHMAGLVFIYHLNEIPNKPKKLVCQITKLKEDPDYYGAYMMDLLDNGKIISHFYETNQIILTTKDVPEKSFSPESDPFHEDVIHVNPEGFVQLADTNYDTGTGMASCVYEDE